MKFDQAISFHFSMAITIKHKMPSYPMELEDINLSYP